MNETSTTINDNEEDKGFQLLRYNRKAKIYILNLIVAISAMFISPDTERFSYLLDFILFLSIAFFTSNVVAPKFRDYNKS